MAPFPMPRSAAPAGAYLGSPVRTNPFQQFFGSRSGANALMGFGAGMLSGNLGNAGLYAMQGAQADDAYATQQKAEAERLRNINESQKALQKFPDLVAAVSAGLPVKDAYNEMFKRMSPDYQDGGVDAPASVREWEYYNSLPPDEQGQYLRMKRANPYLDIGTGFVQPDPVNPGGISGGPIAKDNFTPAYDAAAGAATGKVDVETQASFDSLNSKMPGLKAVVSELGDLAEKATYTAAGKLWDDVVRETGNMPSEGALARTKYMAMVDNQVLPLLRDTFGAAFTVQEGEALRATLGAPDKSPQEKKAVLEAFIEQKARDLAALQSRVAPGGVVSYEEYFR
jgi:hypothetical protein